jgi:hypothetical protein
MVDFYPRVKQLLEEARCERVAFVRQGVEGWISPRTGPFLVDNPIRSKTNANKILREAGLAEVIK